MVCARRGYGLRTASGDAFRHAAASEAAGGRDLRLTDVAEPEVKTDATEATETETSGAVGASG